MTIRITCEPCRKSFNAKDEYAGRTVKCPSCKNRIIIPADGSSHEVTQVEPRGIDTTAAGKASSSQSNIVPEILAAKPQKRPTAASDPNQLMREILAGFQGAFPCVVPTITYRLAALFVAGVMVLLPLIYVGLIGLSGYGLWWHATNNAGLLWTGPGYNSARIKLFLYFAPLVTGAIMVLFMIKPLFARPPKRQSEIEVSLFDEPILHSFVHRLCDAVNAPYPSRIEVDCEVNASASFRSGWSVFRKNDLILRIGLPLLIAMDTRQLAGVLAHEFGHFSQGAGMRLSYVIRTINLWFVRVIYERDEWDQWLVEGLEEENAWVKLVALLTMMLVALSRWILWVLMMIGHSVACTLLRQMEYDADKYETRVAGSNVFESTTRRLAEVGLADMVTRQVIAANHEHAGLPDNLPLCLYQVAAKLPPEMQQVAHQMIDTEKTGFLATHPANRDRIAAAKRQNASGIFQLERPAKVLLKDFTKMSETATLHYFKRWVGTRAAKDRIVPTVEFLSKVNF